MMDLKTLAAELHNSKLEHPKYEDVETQYCLWVAGSKKGGEKGLCSTSAATCGSGDSVSQGTLAAEIATARKKIQDALKEPHSAQTSSTSGDVSAVTKRVDVLEKENKDMRHELKELKHIVEKLQSTIDNLSKSSKVEPSPAKSASTAPKKTEAEDEIDLFGSDEEEESEEKERVREERLKAYEAKKSKKPGPIAKSSVIFEVKPWDDETDMKEMERLVRSIQMDGLVWGASKLVPVGYGIQKLQIMLVVEDDKVSIEELQENIEANEDHVQSVDIAAFNKI
jgi:elongation factor 1-delta